MRHLKGAARTKEMGEPWRNPIDAPLYFLEEGMHLDRRRPLHWQTKLVKG